MDFEKKALSQSNSNFKHQNKEHIDPNNWTEIKPFSY